MALMRFASWNVNGFRAVSRKGDWEWFARTQADVVGLQETKASPDQIPAEQREPEGWHSWWSASTVKKGYSGTAVFSRIQPLNVEHELPDPDFHGEGRVVHLEFPELHFFNIYFPNGGEELSKGVFKRVPYKMGFFDAFLEYAEELRAEKPIVVCGDFNISHREIDLARPKENGFNTGFLPEERAWMDRFVDAGYVDTFRHVHGDVTGAYSWWSYKTRARERNIGWRLDYFFASAELRNNIRDAWIENDVYGSDHCPVGLLLEL
ncbi:MAG: exodeoxyribonuclease III [Mailhella sp.]|nr:exodeoxyribonuclease III [Mailhella sp.]MBQ4326339.1 exodeoxyribonuclease III [Mailhella sp.]